MCTALSKAAPRPLYRARHRTQEGLFQILVQTVSNLRPFLLHSSDGIGTKVQHGWPLTLRWRQHLVTLDIMVTMKWIGISGSRDATRLAEDDVREAVRGIILCGDGIVTGGALGIDYFATDEALKLNPTATQIKIFLPVTLERYATHYRKRAQEGVITSEQAEMLITQLVRIKEVNPGALVENITNTVVDKSTYYERNMKVVEASDELLAVSVNGSPGTQDTIDKARASGKPVIVKSYNI